MATATKKQSTRLNDWQFLAFCIVTAVLLLMSGFMYLKLNKQYDLIGKYELLEMIDNQACRYLDHQEQVNGSFNLTADSPSDQPRLTYTCTTGQTVEGREIQGKLVPAYYSGATVSYFASNADAEKYAEQKVNPLRYWSVDERGQQNGIPQTSHFSFIVTDEDKPYFDAYTVKANAILRVSLPCADPDNPEVCAQQAEEVLNREMKGINVL